MEGYLAELGTTCGPNQTTKPGVDNLSTINLVNGFRYRALARKGLWKVEAVFYPGATLPIGYVCHHVDVNGPDLVRRATRIGISHQNDHEDCDIVYVDRYDWSRWGCPTFGYQLTAMVALLEILAAMVTLVAIITAIVTLLEIVVAMVMFLEIVPTSERGNMEDTSLDSGRSDIACDHCHRDGHTRDRCYDLYPELSMQFGAPRRPKSEYEEEFSESEGWKSRCSSPGGSITVCFYCGNSGHIAEDCSRYMDCIGYGQYVPRDCPNPRKRKHRGSHFGQWVVRHCDHCHSDGHTRDRCFQLYPELRMYFKASRRPKSEYEEEFSESDEHEEQTSCCSSPGGSIPVCFYCCNGGHVAEDCSRYMDCIGYGQYIPKDRPNPRKRKHGGSHFGQREVRYCDNIEAWRIPRAVYVLDQ